MKKIMCSGRLASILILYLRQKSRNARMMEMVGSNIRSLLYRDFLGDIFGISEEHSYV
jgi:hypothetical protein